MYTIKDAAQALNIHPKTIRRWEQAGKFTPQRTLGNQRRFTPQDLNTLKNIKSGSVSSNQPIDRLLTTEQSAQKLGVAPATIQRWAKEGRLNHKVNNQSLLQSQKPQPLPTTIPSPTPLKSKSIPPAYLYSVIGSIILSLLVLGQLYIKNQSLIAKPAVNQLDLAQPTAPALPQVANFLNGRITIGSDTGDLSFLDDKGNLFLKNAALVQGGVFSSYLQLLPAVKPESQIGRQYVDKESGNLMYFDGLDWVALNKTTTTSSDLTLLSASTSASTLTLPYTILGSADQEILTIDDSSTYPVLISQPTKILGNLYAPQFIDSDSETYFIDPSATDLSLSLAGNATISATLTFSNYGEYLTNTTDNYLTFSGGLSVGGSATYNFDTNGNLNANKIESHDSIQVDNIKLNNNTINTTNDDGLKLYDNDSNGIFIKDGGQIGIGTTAPMSTLGILGNLTIGENYGSLAGPTSGAIIEGNVGIGTTAPTVKLEVAGDIKVTGGSFIDDGTTLNVPDYVFEPGYPLLSPVDLADYIHIYRHLPDIPSADEIKNQGLNLSQFALNLLERIENNTLYILNLYDRLTQLEQKFLSPTIETEKLATNFISPLTANGQLIISGNASISGTLTANEIKSSTIDNLKNKVAALTDQYQTQIATASSNAVRTEPTDLLEKMITEPLSATAAAYLNIDSLNANAGFFSDYLAVIGQAVITDLKINNSLTLNSITSLDNNLYLQPSGLGSINLLAGLITLNDSGQVIINGNLIVSGTIIASKISPPADQTLDINIASQSAMYIYSDINQPIATFSGQSAQISQLELAASGTATISAGTNHVLVKPPKLTAKSQIIVTFNDNYTPASKYWVNKNPELNEFTIFTNYPINNDAVLDWLIIN
ncbi:MAG: MerR family transcriptional regulator [Patescibacteria group bacterium]|nr:MerR family transcriptional regulator [Patescibacteria group bacterium]